MKCLKCRREFSNKKEICIYCGDPLDGQAFPQTNYIVNEVSSIFIEKTSAILMATVSLT